MNVAANLERAAFFFPDRPALLERADLRRAQRKDGSLAAPSQHGLKPGERVVLWAANSLEWVITSSESQAGGVVVTLSSLLSCDELSLLVNHAKPRFVFTDNVQGSRALERPWRRSWDRGEHGLARAHRSRARTGEERGPPADRRGRDTLHGGTTGTPKGVMLTHENINVSAQNVAFIERSTEHDRALCFLPLHHVFGQVHIMLGTVASAGSLELLSSFNTDLSLEILAENRVTKFFSVPTIYVRLSGLPSLREKLGAVRYCFSSASSLPAEIIRQWKAATGITISEGYGMTESASAVTYNHYYLHREASVGQPVPGVEVEIRDAKRQQAQRRRGRRDLRERPKHHERLSRQPNGNRGRLLAGWVVPLRRLGGIGRGSVPLHCRSPQGHHHHRRRERLSP